METTVQLLTAVRERHRLTSDYQLAKLLGIDRAQISAYRNGRRSLTEQDAAAVAAALGVAHAVVLAAVQLERSRTDAARKAWREAIKRLGGIAAGIVLALGGGPLPPHVGLPSPAAAVAAVAGNAVYYVKLFLARLAVQLERLLFLRSFHGLTARCSQVVHPLTPA